MQAGQPGRHRVPHRFPGGQVVAQQGPVRGVHVHPGLPESLVHVAAGARHQFEGVLVRGVGEAFQGVDCQVAVLGQDFQVLAAGAPADLPGFGPACPEAAGAVPGVAAARWGEGEPGADEAVQGPEQGDEAEDPSADGAHRQGVVLAVGEGRPARTPVGWYEGNGRVGFGLG